VIRPDAVGCLGRGPWGPAPWRGGSPDSITGHPLVVSLIWLTGEVPRRRRTILGSFKGTGICPRRRRLVAAPVGLTGVGDAGWLPGMDDHCSCPPPPGSWRRGPWGPAPWRDGWRGETWSPIGGFPVWVPEGRFTTMADHYWATGACLVLCRAGLRRWDKKPPRRWWPFLVVMDKGIRHGYPEVDRWRRRLVGGGAALQGRRRVEVRGAGRTGHP
jgi:hypothetical protein